MLIVHKESELIYMLSLIKFIHFQRKNIAIICIYSITIHLHTFRSLCEFSVLCLVKSLFLQKGYFRMHMVNDAT